MLAIKFKRIGKKHQAAFRVVVAEKRKKFKGQCVEDLGFYNPHEKKMDVKGDRVKYWVSVGAKPTSSVWNILVKENIMTGKKISVHKKSKKTEKGSEKAA